MATILSEHVRTFGPDSDPSQVLTVLKRLLGYHMRSQNLLFAPPEFLGYSNLKNWSVPDAFEDIVIDCYLFAIVQRITSLQNQLKIKANVDGLISKNVHHFLIERQRKYDPIGYAVFANLRGGALDAATCNEILLEKLKSGKLLNQSILRLGENLSAPPANSDHIRASLEIIPKWAATVRTLTKISENGRAWVRDFLRRLADAGIMAVVFGDLVDVVAKRVRSDWQARHAISSSELAYEGDDEFVNIVRITLPNKSIEARERWEQLKQVISKRITLLDHQSRVLDRLAVVFNALVQVIESQEVEVPSQSDLIEITGIPRSTLNGDFQILRELIENAVAELEG